MNEQELQAIAADFGVPVEDVRRRAALEEIVPGCPLATRFGLEPEEAMRKAHKAGDILEAFADEELQRGRFFDNEVLTMIFFDAAWRASLIYRLAKEELEGTR